MKWFSYVWAMVLWLVLFPNDLCAQSVSGSVMNEFNDPLIGASVYWASSTIGTSTENDGSFELSTDNDLRKLLVASYIGHISDTIDVSNSNQAHFRLEQQMMDEVLVTGQQSGVILSSVDAIRTEQITTVELDKAACCDLAGCFETQTTVQPQTTNIVTNAKELRILGLPGVYTQVMMDAFPLFQGLSYTYGISSIPGTSVQSIFVAKGANSVLQGYESISGQINVITKESDNSEKLLLNGFANSFGGQQFNVNYAARKENLSNLTTIHVTQPANDRDRDKDNFLDVTKINRYLVSNKVKYGDDAALGLSGTVGISFLNERRIGGQTDFNPETDKGSSEVYGQVVNINQPQVWSRTDYRFNPNHHLTFYLSGFYQDQDSYFGNVKYDAEQTNIYANLQYKYVYGNHNLKTGISLRDLNLKEDISFTGNAIGRTYDGLYNREENVLGVFAENTMELFDNTVTWIAGIRADRHNEFGTILTPRTLVKFNLTSSTTVRASVGTGWRTVNLFSENINLLVASRDVVITETLNPEKALNAGFNITQTFNTENVSGSLTGDLYYTDFQNQIFPDYLSDPTKAIVANFEGKSRSNVVQSELYLDFYEVVYLKTGYTFLDVYREINGEKELLPFNARHKFLVSTGYKPLSKKWQMDLNLHVYGKRRLANTASNPPEYQRPEFSDSYAVLNGQVTYNINRFEWYTGCDNIFDFRQERPIVSWQEPFSPYFDTSSVWGPTMGREFYLGVRFKIAAE